MYEATAYYDYSFRGIENTFTSSDFDLVVDFSHDKLMQGYNVKIINLATGVEKEIGSDNYIDNFNGEFVYKYTDFE